MVPLLPPLVLAALGALDLEEMVILFVSLLVVHDMEVVEVYEQLCVRSCEKNAFQDTAPSCISTCLPVLRSFRNDWCTSCMKANTCMFCVRSS